MYEKEVSFAQVFLGLEVKSFTNRNTSKVRSYYPFITVSTNILEIRTLIAPSINILENSDLHQPTFRTITMAFSIFKVFPSCLHDKILLLTVPFVIVSSFYQIHRKWSIIEQFEKLIKERQMTCIVEPAELHRVINEACRRLEKHGENFPELKGLAGSKNIEATISFNFDSKVAVKGMRGV
ncbi:hypothetical protein BHYA_0052g00350 [Botrytis hyacinthi]|uniref:Uncharacterized protein n=1 Tax=Botrytis hyacinthi TaxID=278943 RepID=A0A4Z1GRI3_9HELO|nr:hypothetical protein BHYA_0052g00350 [Botrytis hyacinthi]